jgi:membrane protein implicated in regulation of membrane protease activity
MAWWIWVIVGLALLSFELFVPLDFYFIFMGLAGITTGALTALGIFPGVWVEWVVFGVLSIIYLFFFRKKLLKRFDKEGDSTQSDLEGSYVRIESEIAANEVGQGHSRGTSWSVRNLSGQTLEVGKEYEISRRDGITLIVE